MPEEQVGYSEKLSFLLHYLVYPGSRGDDSVSKVLAVEA